MVINYIVIPIVSVIFFVLLKKIVVLLKNLLCSQTFRIRSYWIVSFLLFLFTIASHFWVKTYISDSDVESAFSLVNFYSAALFTIFVGYTAFRESELNRFDKLIEKGFLFLRNKNFQRSEIFFSDAFKINKKDPELLFNYSELSLILKKKKLFESLIDSLEKMNLGPGDKIKVFYLKIASFTFEENISGMRSLLKEMFLFLQEDNNALDSFSWEFRDIKGSNIYKELPSGDCKKYFDKLMVFLGKSMPDEEIASFKGDIGL